MTTSTLTTALPLIRRLTTVSAGRLTGVHVDDSWRVPAVKTGAPGWPEALNQLLAARTAGTLTGDTPTYLVLSAGYPVCWLTYDGVVVTSSGPLSRHQLHHQRLAVDALTNLRRDVLARLADGRAARDHHTDNLARSSPVDRTGWVRVADPALPAKTWWVALTDDLSTCRTKLETTTGTDQPLIITAEGYGAYGHDGYRLRLDVLCAINAAATAHDVTADVVGTWAVAEGILASRLDADIAAAFTDAYVGRFASEVAFTAFHLDDIGWHDALRRLGALDYLDTRRWQQHLFTEQFRAIPDRDDGGIVVCRRARRDPAGPQPH